MIRTLTFALRRDQAAAAPLATTLPSKTLLHHTTRRQPDRRPSHMPRISAPRALRGFSTDPLPFRARPIRATVTTEAQTSLPAARPAAAPAQLQDATTARPPAVVAAHDRHVYPQRHLQVGVAKPLRPDVQRDFPAISQYLAAECRRLCAPGDRLPLLSLAGIGRVWGKLCHHRQDGVDVPFTPTGFGTSRPKRHQRHQVCKVVAQRTCNASPRPHQRHRPPQRRRVRPTDDAAPHHRPNLGQARFQP